MRTGRRRRAIERAVTGVRDRPFDRPRCIRARVSIHTRHSPGDDERLTQETEGRLRIPLAVPLSVQYTLRARKQQARKRRIQCRRHGNSKLRQSSRQPPPFLSTDSLTPTNLNRSIANFSTRSATLAPRTIAGGRCSTLVSAAYSNPTDGDARLVNHDST